MGIAGVRERDPDRASAVSVNFFSSDEGDAFSRDRESSALPLPNSDAGSNCQSSYEISSNY